MHTKVQYPLLYLSLRLLQLQSPLAIAMHDKCTLWYGWSVHLGWPCTFRHLHPRSTAERANPPRWANVCTSGYCIRQWLSKYPNFDCIWLDGNAGLPKTFQQAPLTLVEGPSTKRILWENVLRVWPASESFQKLTVIRMVCTKNVKKKCFWHAMFVLAYILMPYQTTLVDKLQIYLLWLLQEQSLTFC